MLSLEEKARNIRLVIFDVDGVLTDGRLYYTDADIDYKAFHAHDGVGIKVLQQTGVAVGIITGHASQMITRRTNALAIQHVYQGQHNKIPAFEDMLQKLMLSPEQVCYVGDDLPDLPLIRRAGLGIAVANAVAIVKKHADWQTLRAGGDGAVREICELIMQAQNTLDGIHNHFLNDAVASS